MRIAILSWGSLINTGVQRGLKIIGGWNAGGPLLPIEFSRISQSGDRAGCLTLVIDEQHGVNVPTKFATSEHTNLNHALTNLRQVENIKPEFKYTVGYVNLLNNTERNWSRVNHPLACNVIKFWAETYHFNAVVWVSLISNFQRIKEIPYSTESAIQYISHLPNPIMEKAIEYIRTAPADVVTPLRRAFDESF